MSELNNPPRVLIVNVEPLHADSATGLTALSLLREWPKDRLAQIYTHPVVPDLEFCRRSLRVGCSTRRAPYNDNHPKIGAPTNDRRVAFAPLAHARHGDAAKLRERADGRLRQLWCLRDIDIREDLVRWIDAFSPDVIYTMLYDLDIMALVVRIAEMYRIPVMPHFMDDWPLTLSRRNVLYRLLDRWWNRRLKSVMALTPTALTICQAMATEYEGRYGGRAVPFMYCVERDALRDKPKRAVTSGATKFTYVGGLHLNRWKVLREIGAAMRELAYEGVHLEAVVYAHPRRLEFYRRNLTIPPVMKVVGSLPHAEVAQAQEDTDWLIHVESFESWDRSFTRLSLSSKLPEYLAAARPIFAYGPGEVASMQYLDELGCGLAVREQNRDRLKDALKLAATSPELQETAGAISLSAARARHDGPSQRALFRQVVEDAVAEWKARHATL